MCSWDRIPAGRATWKGCRLDLENRFYFLVKGKKKGWGKSEPVSVQGEGNWEKSEKSFSEIFWGSKSCIYPSENQRALCQFLQGGLARPKAATSVQKKRETTLMWTSLQVRTKGTLLGCEGCSCILFSLTQEHEPVSLHILTLHLW